MSALLSMTFRNGIWVVFGKTDNNAKVPSLIGSTAEETEIISMCVMKASKPRFLESEDVNLFLL